MITGAPVLPLSLEPTRSGRPGVARDLVRAIQQVRRDLSLDVSDRIKLTIDAPENVLAAARAHEKLIRSETLALEVEYGPTANGAACKVGEGVDVGLAW